PGVACPVCGEPRADGDARFCEVCRYDFVERTGGPPPTAPVPPPAQAPHRSAWELVLTVDPSLDTEPDAVTPAPSDPERTFPVEQPDMLVGRRDERHDIRPALALHDPGASRRHARFLLGADGAVSLHDLGSTNGTKINGVDVVAGSIRPLKEGDEVTLGRWTRIRLRART
ncbi:MAG: FHA domain-containing protein, partial [Polyangiaceae bacterium]